MTNEDIIREYPIQDDVWPSRRWNKEMTISCDLSGNGETVNGYSALQSENERLREALQRFVDFAEKQLDKQGETYRSSMILQAKATLNPSTVKEVGSNG